MSDAFADAHVSLDSRMKLTEIHNSVNFVRVADRVEQGASIAAVGATGRATGAHAHIEVME